MNITITAWHVAVGLTIYVLVMLLVILFWSVSINRRDIDALRTEFTNMHAAHILKEHHNAAE